MCQRIDFTTKDGAIQIYLPKEIVAGDTVSGSTFLSPAGNSSSEQEKCENNLNEYAVDLADSRMPTSLGDFSVTIPAGTASIDCVLKDKRGSVVGSQTMPLQSASQVGKGLAGYCSFSPVQQSGTEFFAWGPFDGNSNHLTVTMDGKEITKLAESPRYMVAQIPLESVGSADVELRTPTFFVKAPIHLIRTDVSVTDTKVARGQTTTLTVIVNGAASMSSPPDLILRNNFPQTVALDGGDVQELRLPQADGVRFIRTIRSLQAGNMQIVVWLKNPPALTSYPIKKIASTN